jgi:F-type H+-transporting ATPase subunit b
VVQSIIVVLSSDPTTSAVKASASEGTSGEGHSTGSTKEATTTAGEGGGAEAHTTEAAAQPDNPILPTAPEFIWGAVTFTILWALMKFVLLKPIQKTMADRADKVRGDIEAADGAKEGATHAIAEYESTLASARVEASRIIDDARAQAEAARKERIAAAEAEVAELRAAAASEVAAAKAEAMAGMRSNVVTIAVQAAEAVVQKPLDVDAQRPIVEEYLNRVGSQN